MQAFSPRALTEFIVRTLTSVGVPEPDAAVVADCLIYANLSGVDSHGIIRLPHYVTRLSNGSIKARPEITSSRPRSGILKVNGDDGLGHVVTSRAVAEGIEICRETGNVMITIGDSSHFGMAGYYLRDITRAGFAGMVTTHTDVRIVPPGARKPFAGTNPIAYGFPTGGEPFVLDFATTSVSFGKIALARAEGREIPSDWGLDIDGEPTTDPHKLEGMHAIAGYKGAGLAMVIDLLSSLFSGMPYGPHINRMYEELDAPRKLGHFLTIWDIGALIPIEEVRARMDEYIRELHELPRQSEDTDVLFPGEPEARRRAERAANGIPIEPGLLGELESLAARLDIDGPDASR
jgi:ureidoglycolate dehydrogenase (NAD+)